MDAFYEQIVPRTVSIKSLLDQRRQEKTYSLVGPKVNEDETAKSAPAEHHAKSNGDHEEFSSLTSSDEISRELPKTLRDLPLPSIPPPGLPLPPVPDLPLPPIPPEEEETDDEDEDNLITLTENEMKNNLMEVETSSNFIGSLNITDDEKAELAFVVQHGKSSGCQDNSHTCKLEEQPRLDDRTLSVAVDNKEEKNNYPLEVKDISANSTANFEQNKSTSPAHDITPGRHTTAEPKIQADIDVVEDAKTESLEEEDVTDAQKYDEEILYAVNDDTQEQTDNLSRNSETKTEDVTLSNGKCIEEGAGGDQKQPPILESKHALPVSSKQTTELATKEIAEPVDISSERKPQIEQKTSTSADRAAERPLNSEPKTPQDLNYLKDVEQESSELDTATSLAQERDETILYAIDDIHEQTDYFSSSINRRHETGRSKSKEVFLAWSKIKTNEVNNEKCTSDGSDTRIGSVENKNAHAQSVDLGNKHAESQKGVQRDVTTDRNAVEGDQSTMTNTSSCLQENGSDISRKKATNTTDKNPYSKCQTALSEMKRSASEGDTNQGQTFLARSRKDFLSLDETSGDLLEDQEFVGPVVIGRSWVPGEPEHSIAYF